MLISKFSEGASKEQIAAFATGLGIELPDQLKRFLEKYNGGETPATSFTIGTISSDIAAFYGLGNVKYPYKSKKMICFQHYQCLPIAFDSFGNEILIDSNSGAILFRDHETDLMTEIAVDLREFISKCQSAAVNPASQKSVQEREQELIRRGRGHIITENLRRMWRAEIDKYANLNCEDVVI